MHEVFDLSISSIFSRMGFFCWRQIYCHQVSQLVGRFNGGNCWLDIFSIMS